MISEAMEFAAKAHEGQFRKGTRRPYIVHPREVSAIVSTMTDDEEIISAAVLHDTIEDCAGVTREMLERQFGPRVAEMVAQESEDKSLTWEERKGETIRRLRTAPREVQMIGPVEGESLWLRFRMQSRLALAWYYKGVRDALREAFEGTEAYEEYCRLIDKNFGPGPAPSDWKEGGRG